MAKKADQFLCVKLDSPTAVNFSETLNLVRKASIKPQEAVE